MRRLIASRDQLAQFLSATLKSAAALAISTSLIGCGWTASHLNGHSSECGVARCSDAAECGDESCTESGCTESGCSDSTGSLTPMEGTPTGNAKESPVPAPKPPAADKPDGSAFPTKPTGDAQAARPQGRRVIVRPTPRQPGVKPSPTQTEPAIFRTLQSNPPKSPATDTTSTPALDTVWYGDNLPQQNQNDELEGLVTLTDDVQTPATTDATAASHTSPHRPKTKQEALRAILEARARKMRRVIAARERALADSKQRRTQATTAPTNAQEFGEMPKIPESILKVSLPESHRSAQPQARNQTVAAKTVQHAVAQRVETQSTTASVSKKPRGNVTIQGGDAVPRGSRAVSSSTPQAEVIPEFGDSFAVTEQRASKKSDSQIEPMFDPIGHFEMAVEKRQTSESETAGSSASSAKTDKQNSPKTLDPALDMTDDSFQWKRIR